MRAMNCEPNAVKVSYGPINLGSPLLDVNSEYCRSCPRYTRKEMTRPQVLCLYTVAETLHATGRSLVSIVGNRRTAARCSPSLGPNSRIHTLGACMYVNISILCVSTHHLHAQVFGHPGKLEDESQRKMGLLLVFGMAAGRRERRLLRCG